MVDPGRSELVGRDPPTRCEGATTGITPGTDEGTNTPSRYESPLICTLILIYYSSIGEITNNSALRLIMKQLVQITKALADETRLRSLAALHGQELCLCQLTQLFELAPSTMSKHLSLLRSAGLIQSRKEGRWVFYSWSDPSASELVTLTLG